MIIIADSGSTKTDWSIIDSSNNCESFKTEGLNPYQNSSVIKPGLASNIDANSISQIFFYGAGCSTEKLCSIVKEALSNVFPNSNIEVEHDLLGAARALCQREAGMIAILGTGSNSCVYDGSRITDHIPVLGHLLDDEGSGTYIGKKLVKAFIHKTLPDDLYNSFKEKYDLNYTQIMEKVYKEPYPNKFLASFTLFLNEQIDSPYALNLVRNSFTEFFDCYICKYPNHKNYPLHSVGSIGYYFQEILSEVAKIKNVTLGTIEESPMKGLIKYHTQS